MTISFARKGDQVRLTYTYGPATFTADEHVLHMASAWGQLGRLLAEQPEHVEATARLHYERYRASSGGVSAVSGAELPDWDGQSDQIREHWRKTVTG